MEDTSEVRLENTDLDNDIGKKNFTPLDVLYDKGETTRRGTISY